MLTGVRFVRPPDDCTVPVTLRVVVVPPPVARICHRSLPSQSFHRNVAWSRLASISGAPHTSLAAVLVPLRLPPAARALALWVASTIAPRHTKAAHPQRVARLSAAEASRILFICLTGA